ncbi:MAG: Na+/H+ antiporter NhaA [Pseudomonadota bacterium]
MALSQLKAFFKLEAAAGLLLMGTAALAIIVKNTPASGLYELFLTLPVSVSAGDFKIAKPLLLWINDGLMAVFFLLIGLEVKREILAGELSSREQLTLPLIAALGGIALPAAVYLAVSGGTGPNANGWAIPAATDIAFALGIMAIVGSRVPLSLKVLLTAIAIVDDLAAIIIIAAFYTSNLSFSMLGGAVLCTIALVVLNVSGVRKIAPYILVGVLAWVFVLKSGIHATLAGVATGLAIPMRGGYEPLHETPLEKLEHALHPWIAYMIIPIFAFANAGLPLLQMTPADLAHPVSLGIALGLLLGKPIGVYGFSFIAIRAGFAQLPEGATMRGILGVGLLTGVGFTMSLFIGSLAFEGPEMANKVRLGILLGSLGAGIAGYGVLRSLKPAADTPAS